MRSLALVGLVVALLALTAVASPWVAWGVADVAGRSFDFGRVYHRVFEALLVMALVVTWRPLDLGGPTDLGFTRTERLRQLWLGIRIGLGGLVVGLGVATALGAVVFDLRFPPGKTVYKALLGLLAAIEVGMLEEALFRGMLLRRFSLDAGRTAGVAAATGVYALVHGLRRVPTAGAVDAWSGAAYTLALLGRLVTPAAVAPLAGLTLLGLLLVAARLSSRALWLPIGIHMSWVAMFRVGRLFFYTRPEPRWLVGTGWPPLVGGAAGMIAVAVAALLLARAVGDGSRRPSAIMTKT